MPGAGLYSHLQQEYLLFHLFQVKKSLVTFKVVVTYTIEQRLVDYGLRAASGPKLKTVFVNEVLLEPSHTQVFSVAASILSGWVE